jgi:hypothetical protein
MKSFGEFSALSAPWSTSLLSTAHYQALFSGLTHGPSHIVLLSHPLSPFLALLYNVNPPFSDGLAPAICCLALSECIFLPLEMPAPPYRDRATSPSRPCRPQLSATRMLTGRGQGHNRTVGFGKSLEYFELQCLPPHREGGDNHFNVFTLPSCWGGSKWKLDMRKCSVN